MIEPTESGLLGSPCDSQRMKNAITTIEAHPISVTTKRVMRFTFRALPTAIRIAVKPIALKSMYRTARNPCLVNGKMKLAWS